MKRISKNSRIILLRYDKGREIAIMDKGKYTDKCMNMLKTKQFCKLQKNTTKFIEIKIQRATRKMKMKFSPKEYLNIYPTDSSPGKFYGTAKKHKFIPTGTIDDLPVRPIISNLGIASCHSPSIYPNHFPHYVNQNTQLLTTSNSLIT